MQCVRCGAAIGVPEDLYAETACCAYCGTVRPLPEELRRARTFERQARERSAKAHTEVPDTYAKRQASGMLAWVIVSGVLGIVAAGGAVVWLGGTDTKTNVPELSDSDRRANLAALEAKLVPLRKAACNHTVVAATARTVAASLSLNMHADGNCARLVMASTAPGAALGASLKPPAAAAIRLDGKGTLELEHCPTETGDHALALTGPTSGYAYTVVDCPPEREKFVDDPEKNGSSAVSARMKALRDAGCSRVLLAPERLSGPRSLTSTMEPGRFCAVLVAATGVPGAKLGLRVASPIGEKLADVPPAPIVESVLCAKMAGPHKLELSPTTQHYYTLAGIDCPRKIAEKTKK
jgi:hypothetical protein